MSMTIDLSTVSSRVFQSDSRGFTTVGQGLWEFARVSRRLLYAIYTVQGLWFQREGLWLRVQDLGFKVSSGFSGLGIRGRVRFELPW